MRPPKSLILPNLPRPDEAAEIASQVAAYHADLWRKPSGTNLSRVARFDKSYSISELRINADVPCFGGTKGRSIHASQKVTNRSNVQLNSNHMFQHVKT